MKIRYTPQARDDLNEIFAYLDERAPAAAKSVKERVVLAAHGARDG
jgi:plasmid stabilization system protein ParE